MELHKELLRILVCPKCKNDLNYEGNSLFCSMCKEKYEIKEGVPIMLANLADVIKREKDFHEEKFKKDENFDEKCKSEEHAVWHDHWIRQAKVFKNYINSNSKILTVGTGPGPVEFFLGKEYNITSTDLSFNALGNIVKYKLNNKLVVCDATMLPFKKDCFDVVIFTGILHHIPKSKFRECIFETINVLKNGGIFIAVEPVENNLRKIVKNIFKKKWKSVHTSDERDLDMKDILFLRDLNCAKNFRISSFSPFFQFFVGHGISLPPFLQKILIKFRFLDIMLEKIGFGWSNFIIFEIDKRR